MSRFALLLTSLALFPASHGPVLQCRCAQLTLERYFQQAELVVVGRVRSVRQVPASPGLAAPRLEVSIVPQFGQGTFKGSLDGVTLATPLESATCGVPVAVGRIYLIFASHGDPNDSSLAWFDTCSGSREYPSRPDAPFESYLDVPVNRVLARLFELAAALQSGQAAAAEPFQVSPACWSQPRIYHEGTPPPDLRDRIRLTTQAGPLPDTGGVHSPNGAYRVWFPPPGDRTTGGAAPFVLVDVESRRVLRIDMDGAIAPPAAQWVNEKLLFLRVVWGRVQFTDLVVDVERGLPIYEELARYGDNAFHQYQAACLGQCPCLPVAGSADSLADPPAHRPLSGEYDGLTRLEADNLAFLDGDWDGRVFTEAGGRRFVVSALKGHMGREEYPVTVREVRRVGEVYWIDVELYRENPCDRPDAEPVHRGWVPAFSRAGRLVAGTWPGGC